MIHRALRLLLPIAFPTLLAAQGGSVAVPDGREFQQFKVLTLGLTDRWEFETVAGEFLHCVVETSAFDPVLTLLDPSGEPLGSDDGEGTRSELRQFAPTTGKLVFNVTGYDGRGGGSYRFWLLRYRTEALAVDGAAEHTFGPERWWHYRVPTKKGDVLVPRVPFGGRLTAVIDTEQRNLPEWHGGYTAQRDGDVLLRVEGNEKDRCRVDAQLARQGTLPIEGVLDSELPAGGMRIVQHHLEAGAWTLELDTPDHDLTVDLRETDPGRTSRWGWTGHLEKNGRQRKWLLVHAAMDAELVLRNHHGLACCRGRFVKLQDSLQFGAARTDQLPLGGGRLFEMHGQPGQLLRVQLESNAFDGRFDIWTPDGGVHRFDDGRRLDLNPQHTFLVQQIGLHRVLVYTEGGAGSGPFTLRADDLPMPQLVVGTPLPLAAGNGNGFIHLACQAEQQLWLSVQSREFDATLIIWGPDGKQIGIFDGGGIGGDVLTGFVAKQAGVHTLQAGSRRGTGTCVVRAIQP